MRRVALLVLVPAMLAAGCLENPAPTRARLLIEGELGKTVQLVVAKEFVAGVAEGGQTRVVMLRSDTLVVTLPFDEEYDIETEHQFVAVTSRNESDVQNFRMRVYLDERLSFDEAGTLTTEPFRFVYVFNRPITRDPVVI